jgi:hypothetical protein
MAPRRKSEASLVGRAGGAGGGLLLPTARRPGAGGQPGQDQRVDARGLLGGEPEGVESARVGTDQDPGAGQRLVGEQLGGLLQYGGVGGRVAEGADAVGVEAEAAAEPLVDTAVFAPPGQHDQRAARGEAFGFVPGRDGGRGHGVTAPNEGKGEGN